MVADNGCSRGSGSSVSSSFPFREMPQCIPVDEKNTKTWKFATEAALEVIGALNIARGKEFVIPVPSKGITAEERLRLKRYNRKISQKSRVGFNVGTVNGYKRCVSKRYKFQL